MALPVFGTRLVSLAGLRGLDVGSLAQRASVPEADVEALVGGARPESSLLRQLAPALGVHASDLFVIGGLPVPEDLAPLDAEAGDRMTSLAWSLIHLPGAVSDLHGLIRSMPQMPRPQPPAPPPAYQLYPAGSGGLILRMLHNRNLGWSASARYLFGIGGFGMLSASTIGLIGRGEKELTPGLLAGFGAFLDIAARDLAAVTGIDFPDDPTSQHPDSAAVARLIWDARRLTGGQLDQVQTRAHAIQHERADSLEPGLRCRCPGIS